MNFSLDKCMKLDIIVYYTKPRTQRGKERRDPSQETRINFKNALSIKVYDRFTG